MKIVKVLVVVALVLIVAVAVVAAVAMSNLDRAAKVAIQRGGTYALGVNTTLASADIGVMSGTFSMNDLNVANPEGFDSPHFLALGDGNVRVSYGSLLEDTVILPELTLRSIDVHLDKEDGSSNYQTILDNLKKFESGDAPKEPAPSGGKSKKLIIEKLTIEGIVVHADVLGDEPATVNVDAIHLTNVGSEGGDTLELAGVAAVVVKAVMLAAVQAGAGVLPDALVGELQNGLAGLESLTDLGIGVGAEIDGVVQDLDGLAQNLANGVITSADDLAKDLEGAADDIKKNVDDIGEQLEDAGKGLEDAAKGIGGLFGGKKKEDDEDDGGE